MRSFHPFVPGTNAHQGLNAAPPAGLQLALGRRLLPLSSIRSVRPSGRLGRLLTQPPHLHRPLAHLLTQAHQLLPPPLLALAGAAGVLLLLAVFRARARRRLARSLAALEQTVGAAECNRARIGATRTRKVAPNNH